MKIEYLELISAVIAAHIAGLIVAIYLVVPIIDQVLGV